MRLAIDSNRYADFCRGDPKVVDQIRGAASIGLPLVVLAELRAGFRAGVRAAENEVVLSRFLRAHDVAVLACDEATTHIYADIFSELRRAGTPVPSNDIWIAATVVQHGYTLLTRDVHFERIPRVPRLI
jgi:tRNA(fMet)-specific endonuclease VapC